MAGPPSLNDLFYGPYRALLTYCEVTLLTVFVVVSVPCVFFDLLCVLSFGFVPRVVYALVVVRADV